MSEMFEIVMGLEVHAQLNTKTKLFCGCSTSFGEKPNTNTCPVCLGLPGSLPTLNKESVIKAIKLGTALGSTINNNSIFERKNYFYPDSPLGYQISQLEVPIVEFGTFLIKDRNGEDKTIRLNRAHLEIDAGKSIHEKGNSLVDLNRAGTPLLEIVTEPDFSHYSEVTDYLKKLQTLIRYIEIGDANLAEGSFRCDVNISIRPKGDKNLYTRVEIKNMNSFKFIEKAIQYESQRQIEAWEDGEYEQEVFQETRLFDTDTMTTESMRGKEEASDYRYFPDPDLLKVTLTDEILTEGKNIPELPAQIFDRYVNELGVKPKDAERVIADKELNTIFSKFIDKGFEPSLIVTWLLVELVGRLKKESIDLKDSPISLQQLEDVIKNVSDSKISGAGGKKIFDYLMEEDDSKNVNELIKELNLEQMSNTDELEKIVTKIVEENPDLVAEFKGGKKKIIGSFVGKVMKETGGKANPKLVNEMITKKLNS